MGKTKKNFSKVNSTGSEQSNIKITNSYLIKAMKNKNYKLVRKLINLNCPVHEDFIRILYLDYQELIEQQNANNIQSRQIIINNLKSDIDYYLFEHDWSLNNYPNWKKRIFISKDEDEDSSSESYSFNDFLYFMRYLVRENNLEMLQKLYQNGYEIPPSVVYDTLKYFKTDIFLWLYKERKNIFDWELLFSFFNINTKFNEDDKCLYYFINFLINMKNHMFIQLELILNEKKILNILKEEEKKHRYPFHDNLPYFCEKASYIFDLFRESDIKNSKINTINKIHNKYIYEALKSYNNFIKIFINTFEDIKPPSFKEILKVNENGSINIEDEEEEEDEDEDIYINKFLDPINTAAFYNDIETTQHLLNKGWKFTEYCSTLCFISDHVLYNIHKDDDGIENPNMYYKWCLKQGAPVPKKINFLKSQSGETQLIMFSLMKNYKFNNDEELNLFLLEFNKHLKPHRDSWNDNKEHPFDINYYYYTNMMYDCCLQNKYVRKILFNKEITKDYIYIKKYVSYKLQEIEELKKRSSKLPMTKDLIDYCVNPFF
jgi:hypothetical protein